MALSLLAQLGNVPFFIYIILGTFMGRGDKRTRRGKIFKASNGKNRPAPKTLRRRAKKAAKKAKK